MLFCLFHGPARVKERARGLFAARFSSLVLLDEPRGFADEHAILSGILRTFKDVILMVSLHRLHLLPKFDRLIYLEHGRILADDKTATLLAMPGPVKLLWERYQNTK